MDYIEFVKTLPINNFHRFDDPDDWLDVYSNFYPTDQEREEIYWLEDEIYSYR